MDSTEAAAGPAIVAAAAEVMVDAATASGICPGYVVVVVVVVVVAVVDVVRNRFVAKLENAPNDFAAVQAEIRKEEEDGALEAETD